MFKCLFCDSEIVPKRTNKNYNQKYCCYQCSVEHKKSLSKPLHSCNNCGKLTRNKKFCSSSCSATVNNTGTSKSTVTKNKIGASISEYKGKLSSEEKEEINKKRLVTYVKNNGSSKCECSVCRKIIYKANKHGMCISCYSDSDAATKARGHFSKSYKKGYVFSPYAGKSIYLLSGLEIGYANWLNKNNINWDKPKSIKYTLDGKDKRYYPDFLLVDSNEIIEIKGYWWEGDREKMSAVINQNPELVINVLTKKELDIIGVKSIRADTGL